MKITQSFLVIATIAAILFSCKKEVAKTLNAATTTTIESDTKLASTSFNIDGMTCAVGCAKTIEEKLTNSIGVKSASVDFENKTAKVEYDVNAQSPENLVEIVEKTGDGITYKVSNVKNSQDKAMLYDQEEPKKSKKSDKTVYTTTATSTTAIITAEKPAGKPSCCAAKKNCSGEERKDNL